MLFILPSLFTDLDLSEENLPKVYDSFEKYLIRDLGHDIDSDIAKNISKEVKQFYFGGAPVTVQKLDSFLEVNVIIIFCFSLNVLDIYAW